MDRLITSLTVAELYGVLALAFAMFYLAGMIARHAPPDAMHSRLIYWSGFFVIAGLPIYLGLRVLFPFLPNF